MSTFKIEIVDDAFSRLRISGLTTTPSAKEQRLALNRLESMAAVWEKAGICVGYNFEQKPRANSAHNVELAYQPAFEANLAVKLLADYGKKATPELLGEARGSLATMTSSLAKVPKVNYPTRQPIGSGNSNRAGYGEHRAFYPAVDNIPQSCAINRLFYGEVENYTEDFSSYLKAGEDVDSYTLAVNDTLIVSNEELVTPLVKYTVQAKEINDSPTNTTHITITVTTSEGRVTVRLIPFVTEKVPE